MILKKLFEPIEIKGRQVKNRVVMVAMHANMGNMKEGVTDKAIDLYVARAKGGFGMIGIGVIDTYFIEGASSPLAFFIDNDEHVKNHSKLVKEIKKHGAVVYAQVGVRRLWPVSLLHRLPKLSTLPEEKIPEMVESMVKAAVRVREAGYDAVSLGGHGGTAAALFMSKVMNDRTDKWGGSLEGRLRFPVETIRGMRRALGDDFPIFMRLTSSEFIEGGYNFEEIGEIARHLQAAGVDLFNQTGGSHATSVAQMTPNVPRATYAFLAREIKKAVTVPVSAAVRINHPVLAEDILRRGWADMIIVARGSLADPEWPNKARRGDFDDINLCIACMECMDAVVSRDEPICCTVNPRVGRVPEAKPLPRARKAKRVLVIGGGCTGLQAALTCAERGHQVTLVEKEASLGGKWQAAAAPPGREELFNFLYWLVRQVKSVGVDIRTGVQATPKVIKQLAPEAIIVCTGGKPRIPDIPGVNRPNVVLAQHLLDGKANVGERVAVVGGGGVGIETALFLAKRWSSRSEVVTFLIDQQAMEQELAMSLAHKGHQVTLIEQQDKIGAGLGPSTRWVLNKEIKLANVQVLTGTPVTEIRDNGVVISKGAGEQFVAADSVVIATGFVPDTSVYEALKNLAPEVYVAGTATTTGHTINGIGNAFEAAMGI